MYHGIPIAAAAPSTRESVYHKGTLRDVTIVLDLGDIPIEMTNSVFDRSLGCKDGKRGAVKARDFQFVDRAFQRLRD
jgi:hypothetical protein